MLFQVGLDDVVEIADSLTGGCVGWWLAGGWGIDGLLGSQTRPHEDVDICIDVANDGEQRAVRLLGGLGFQLVETRARGGRYLPVRCILRNRAGRAIDLLMVQREVDVAPPDPLTGWAIPVLTETDITSGEIDGHRFPVLSVTAHLEARSVYQPMARDHRDMVRLCEAYGLELPANYLSRTRRYIDGSKRLLGRFQTASALLIAVPEVGVVLADLDAEDSGLPPHITVLYPFKKPGQIKSPDVRKLTELARSAESPIPFELDKVRDFNGDAYLAPNPSQPFVELTQTASEIWPDHPPYGGKFDDIVPHLTLGVRDLSPVEIDELSNKLPVSACATELLLLTRNRRGRWTEHSRFSIGSRSESKR